MGLQHTDAVIMVDNQPGKAVAFTVDKPVAVGRGGSVQAARHPHLESTADHLLPEVRSERILIETEDADRDGADLVMARGKILSIRRMDTEQVSFGGSTLDFGNSPGKHPGMEPEDGILAVGTEYDFIHQAWSG